MFQSDVLYVEDRVNILGEQHAFVESVVWLDLLPNFANDQTSRLRQRDREAPRLYARQLKLRCEIVV